MHAWLAKVVGYWLLWSVTAMSFADSAGPSHACPADGGVMRVLLDGEFHSGASTLLKIRSLTASLIALTGAEKQWVKELTGASKNNRVHL